jgi:HTH-type transcriptional regulator/antitoxin HigA
MKAKIIRTEQEYEEYCARIYELMHSSNEPLEPGSQEGEEMELLTILVEKYEQENMTIEAPTPIEAIKFRMDQMDLRQVDIAPLFGGETRVSEVLNGKKPLTFKMISLLHQYLDIPLESLLSANANYNLKPEKHQKMIHIPSIRESFKRKGIIATV